MTHKVRINKTGNVLISGITVFLFREHRVILKSSAYLPVFVRSWSNERSRSYVAMSVSSTEISLCPEYIPGAILAEPYTKHTAAALRWWLFCRGVKDPSSLKKQ